MPIFEEKLICPLAVRFTQEHIRPVFQDGRDLEATIDAIVIRPGTGDYDVILETPFPSIEVVRWRARDGGDAHWVTLDNRRLYCLQRAAAALWPKRVAVTVEVLYAATDSILRKNDSSTGGLTVGIGHSLKALTGRWDWHEVVSVQPNGAAATTRPDFQAALTGVKLDDGKSRLEELLDAPAAPSMLDLFLHGSVDVAARAAPQKTTDAGSEGSTTGPPTPRSRASSGSWDPAAAEAAEWAASTALREALIGRWEGEQGETYEIWAEGHGTWACKRTGGGGNRKFTLWYDETSDSVWWANLNLCVDAAEARRQPGQVQWYSLRDNGRRRARFTWRFLGREAQTRAAPAAAKAAQGKGGKRRTARAPAGAARG